MILRWIMLSIVISKVSSDTTLVEPRQQNGALIEDVLNQADNKTHGVLESLNCTELNHPHDVTQNVQNQEYTTTLIVEITEVSPSGLDIVDYAEGAVLLAQFSNSTKRTAEEKPGHKLKDSNLNKDSTKSKANLVKKNIRKGKGKLGKIVKIVKALLITGKP